MPFSRIRLQFLTLSASLLRVSVPSSFYYSIKVLLDMSWRQDYWWGIPSRFLCLGKSLFLLHVWKINPVYRFLVWQYLFVNAMNMLFHSPGPQSFCWEICWCSLLWELLFRLFSSVFSSSFLIIDIRQCHQKVSWRWYFCIEIVRLSTNFTDFYVHFFPQDWEVPSQHFCCNNSATLLLLFSFWYTHYS